MLLFYSFTGCVHIDWLQPSLGSSVHFKCGEVEAVMLDRLERFPMTSNWSNVGKHGPKWWTDDKVLYPKTLNLTCLGRHASLLSIDGIAACPKLLNSSNAAIQSP